MSVTYQKPDLTGMTPAAHHRAHDHANMCTSARFRASVAVGLRNRGIHDIPAAAVAAGLRKIRAAPGEDAAPGALAAFAAWKLGQRHPQAAKAWEDAREAFTHR